jgi:hypothetical protein
MTGDGTRLIIHLEGGSARVWDIRDPEERRKDLQAEWAERVPAGAYLDTLWATDTSDDKLRDAVINDASLSPLRRLVAMEMLEERVEDDRLAVEQAFEAVTKDQTDKAVVQAAAAARTDLPKRVHAQLIAKAAEWVYDVPKPTLLDESVASAILQGIEAGETRRNEVSNEMIRNAVATRIAAVGLDHPSTVEAVRKQLNWGGATHVSDLDTIVSVAKAVEANKQLQGSMTALLAIDAATTVHLSRGEFAEAARLARLMGESWQRPVPRDVQWGDCVWLVADPYVAGDGTSEALSNLDEQRLRELAIAKRARLLKGHLVSYPAVFSDLGGVVIGSDLASLVAWFDRVALDGEESSFFYRTWAHARVGDVARAMELWSSIPRLGGGDQGATGNVHLIGLQAVLRAYAARGSSAELASVGQLDLKADPTLKAPLTVDEHRQRAREALARAKALMQPAPDGTPSPWANDEDAKALIAEAEELIGGAR